jgi:transcriptional regulator with XRE-family HTH domain
MIEKSIIMNTRKQVIFPKYHQFLEQLGDNFKLARKKCKHTTIQVAERAGIAHSTLYLIEKGETSVAIGAYFNVLRVLGLQEDLIKLAIDDVLGRNYRI